MILRKLYLFRKLLTYSLCIHACSIYCTVISGFYNQWNVKFLTCKTLPLPKFVFSSSNLSVCKHLMLAFYHKFPSSGSLNNSGFIPTLSENPVSICGLNSFRFSEKFCFWSLPGNWKRREIQSYQKCQFKTALTGKVLCLEVVCPEEQKKEDNESGF